MCVQYSCMIYDISESLSQYVIRSFGHQVTDEISNLGVRISKCESMAWGEVRLLDLNNFPYYDSVNFNEIYTG